MMGRSAVAAEARTVPRWVRIVAVLGLVGVTAYVASWAVAGAVTAGYDPMEQAISELFAVGAPTLPRMLLVVSLVASGVALLAFGPAMDRGLPGHGRAGPVVASVSGVMTVLIVAFPCTAGCPGAGTSFTDTMHVVVAGTGYLSLLLAPLLVAWRVRDHDRSLAVWSVVLGGVALAGFVIRNLGVADGLAGLQQRVFNTTADLWYVVAAIWLLRRPHA